MLIKPLSLPIQIGKGRNLMKRDFDLLRSILFRIEEQPANVKITTSTFSDLCEDNFLISLHISLLIEQEMIIAQEIPRTRRYLPDYWIIRLTSRGYDYLDSIRNDSIWERTKSKISQLGESLPIEIVQSIASQLIIDSLQL